MFSSVSMTVSLCFSFGQRWLLIRRRLSNRSNGSAMRDSRHASRAIPTPGNLIIIQLNRQPPNNGKLNGSSLPYFFEYSNVLIHFPLLKFNATNIFIKIHFSRTNIPIIQQNRKKRKLIFIYNFLL